MPLISLDQLLNKTVYAAESVNLYSTASDYAQPVQTVRAGNLVGVVYSWLSPLAGTRSNYFMMIQVGSKYYYLKFADAKKLSLSKVLEQGTKTVAMQVAEEKAKQEEMNMSFGDKALKNVKSLAVLGIVLFAAIYFLKSLKR